MFALPGTEVATPNYPCGFINYLKNDLSKRID